MKFKAVFLDKDGSIIPTNTTDNNVELNEEVIEGLQLLQSNGYLLVIVSNNQQNKDEEPIKGLCSKIGIYLDGYYTPQKMKMAAGDMDIDLSSSWMIGDIPNDIEEGKNAGCKTILINQAREFANAAKQILEVKN